MFFEVKHVGFRVLIVVDDPAATPVSEQEGPHVRQLQQEEPERDPEDGGHQPRYTDSPHDREATLFCSHMSPWENTFEQNAIF